MAEKSNRGQSSMPYWLGRHPFEPADKRPVHLGRGGTIPRIVGKGSHRIGTHLYLSTDRITCTDFCVQPGEYFEPPDIHSGDEVYFVLEGTATVLNPETGEVLRVEQGESLLIPKGTWHQTYNFGNRQLVIACTFAPKIWSEDDRGVSIEFEGQPVYYKGRV